MSHDWSTWGPWDFPLKMKDGDVKMMPSGAVMVAFQGCWYEDEPEWPDDPVQDWFPFYELNDYHFYELFHPNPYNLAYVMANS